LSGRPPCQVDEVGRKGASFRTRRSTATAAFLSSSRNTEAEAPLKRSLVCSADVQAWLTLLRDDLSVTNALRAASRSSVFSSLLEMTLFGGASVLNSCGFGSAPLST